MRQKYKVFFLGVLAGLLSMAALWALLFTGLDSNIKLVLFIALSLFAFVVHVYALKGVKKASSQTVMPPDYWRDAARNYRWFGVFFSGAAFPYIALLFVYVALKNF